jgi:hypothetical chaperone protein
MIPALGLDFGTTNSVLAMPAGQSTPADEAAQAIQGARVLRFDGPSGPVDTLRTALAFWRERGALANAIGPWAIERFIADPEDVRFMQSIKTFAASPHFNGAYVHARRMTFEDLLDVFFAGLAAHRPQDAQALPRRLVVGRPVEYAGAAPDPALAAERYRTAFARHGFDEILFVYEPVAAAFFYAQRLTAPATILVADFGGGTSDFSLMRFTPGADGFEATPIAQGGVGVAGDQFDYRIIEHVVLPHLGKGGRYRSMDKILDLPASVFASFARWNLLSVLRASDEFRDLKKLAKDALEPEKIQRMIDLVEDDQGYPLYQAVSHAKMELSQRESAQFAFAPLGADFRVEIKRSDFERWIAPDLTRIERALEETLASAKLAADKIDRIFMTGGASFTPALRALFAKKFGADKIDAGDELLSIASGLAVIGARADAARWATSD